MIVNVLSIPRDEINFACRKKHDCLTLGLRKKRGVLSRQTLSTISSKKIFNKHVLIDHFHFKHEMRIKEKLLI